MHYWNHYFEKEEKMSIVLSVVFYGIMFSLNPTQLCCQSCVAVLSPVTCLHLPWWDLTVMQIIIITPCVATKLKVSYLPQMFFLSLLTLCMQKAFLLYSSTATSLCMYLAFSLLWKNIFTIKLGKLWTPKIFLECYCVAR